MWSKNNFLPRTFCSTDLSLSSQRYCQYRLPRLTPDHTTLHANPKQHTPSKSSSSAPSPFFGSTPNETKAAPIRPQKYSDRCQNRLISCSYRFAAASKNFSDLSRLG